MQTISISFSHIVNVVILPYITLYEFFIFLVVVYSIVISKLLLIYMLFKNINGKKIVTTKAEKINTNIYTCIHVFPIVEIELYVYSLHYKYKLTVSAV